MSIAIPKYKDGYNQTYLEISMKQRRGRFMLLETCSALGLLSAVDDTEVAIRRQYKFRGSDKVSLKCRKTRPELL